MRREIRCCHKYLPMAIIVAIMIPPQPNVRHKKRDEERPWWGVYAMLHSAMHPCAHAKLILCTALQLGSN